MFVNYLNEALWVIIYFENSFIENEINDNMALNIGNIL